MKNLTTSRRERASPRRPPTLRFSPYAWAKLICLRDLGPTEIGAFGLSAEGDPLLVEDVRLLRQACTAATVRFADEAVADYFDEQVDQGLAPERFARIWLHTHPGSSSAPSGTDEETFARAFGGADWSLMFILAKGGATYARLRFGVGPGGEMEFPVAVDYAAPFAAADRAAWEAEYVARVEHEALPTFEEFAELSGFGDDWYGERPRPRRKEGRLERSSR